jgi:hypothetical protein
MYIYLDESGDLGFDFVNKKPSKFFTICVMVIYHYQEQRFISNQVKRVLIKKLKMTSKNKSRKIEELKATSTTIEIKKYFFDKIKNINFGVYSITLNKKRVYKELIDKKHRIYNFITRILLEKIDFNNASQSIYLILDKSKNKKEIKEFNQYLFNHLQAGINPIIPFYIHHKDSKEDLCLNAVDLFAWGIFRKHERKDIEWFDIFKEKIKFEDTYLP